MRYFAFLYLSIFNVDLLSSDNIKIPTSNQLHIFTYTFDDSSVCSIDGTERTNGLMENRNILSVSDMKSGLEKIFRIFKDGSRSLYTLFS